MVTDDVDRLLSSSLSGEILGRVEWPSQDRLGRLEQSGAVAFAVVIFHRAGDRGIRTVLDASLAGLQSELFHLLADLGYVPTKKARGLCDRPAVVDFVLEVADIGLGPGLA